MNQNLIMEDNMTEQELKDKAICIAFRTFTCGPADLVNSEADFENITFEKLEELVWLPFENTPTAEVYNNIVNLAFEIENSFRHLIKRNKND